ncbi:MAG TPA: YceI family protein [Tepidisphaeraceae bacterium]|jgi:polyisoprenoid-binding protein YceI
MRSASFFAVLLSAASVSFAADSYKVDPVHSSVVFSAHHANAGYVFGRFNGFGGSFTLDDADPTKSTFAADIKVDTVDTANEKRDAHLKAPDWFNAKQYPTITFKSTKVEKADDKTLTVTGDLTFHGVTKQASFPVKLTGKGEFPAGTVRAGILAEFVVKMSDYGIKGMPGAVGDDIKLIVAFEGTK